MKPSLVHRDGDFKLLQSGEQRLQELGEGFGGDRQDHEEAADRHELQHQDATG